MCLIDRIFIALTAIGTLAVAALAIWGDWFRSWLASPRVEIRPHNLRGTVTRFTNGTRVIYYHLKASNTRRWAVARNCRIILTAIYRRGPDQRFRASLVPVPPQFVWAPAELTPIVIDLSGEQVIDFGRVVEGGNRFEPILYSYPNDFLGFVGPNEAVRFQLQAIAGGSPLGSPFIYEVAWNGEWSDNLDTMGRNLTIGEVDNTTKE